MSTAQVIPVMTRTGDIIGANSTLSDFSQTPFASVFNMNDVTMGGEEIGSEGFGSVQIDGTNLYVMNLPYDKEAYVATGVIKPDLQFLKKIEGVNRTLEDSGIDFNNLPEENSVEFAKVI